MSRVALRIDRRGRLDVDERRVQARVTCSQRQTPLPQGSPDVGTLHPDHAPAQLIPVREDVIADPIPCVADRAFDVVHTLIVRYMFG